jgi:undecaprenyl-diphosphatase
MDSRPRDIEEHIPARSRLLRVAVTIGILAFAIHVLLPRVGEVGDALEALRTGRWHYLALAALGAGGTYLTGAWTVTASIGIRLHYRRTVLAQVAGSLMAVITPAAVGWVAVTDTYLRKAGADEYTAHTATTLTMLITLLSHIALLIVLIPLLPSVDLPEITLPNTLVIIEIAGLVLVAVGVVFWMPSTRRRILRDLSGMVRALPAVLGDPRRSLTMVVSAIAGNIAFGIALIGSVAAYGPVPSPLGVLVAYMFAATVAAISPTPGGLGAMEAALIAALTRLGVAAGPAVAAALTFRLITFWAPLPIGGWALRRGRKNGWL